MDRRRSSLAAVAALLALGTAACSEPTSLEDISPPNFAVSAIENEFSDMMATVNAGLAEEGADYRLEMVEWMAGPGSEEMGQTIFFNNRGNKQLAFDFVPFDGRRGWSGPSGGPMDDITYAIDQTFDAVPPFGGLSAAQTTAAIQSAMGTWHGQDCSTLPIVQNPDFGLDLGVVAFIFGLGGSPFVVADVMHAGWRDINFGGGVIGATFTFGFIDGAGNFTDIDNNGKLDAAFREIYYDPSFPWAINGNIDVETVALHEAGHGLSQAHFGKLFRTDANGFFHFAPRAVMNAGYTGPQQALLGTDNAGHCSIWGSWPNN